MKNNIKSYVVIGLAIGALTAGGGLSVYAATTDTEPSTTISAKGNFRGGDKKDFATKFDFDAFVADGVIEQETADKLKEVMAEKSAERQAEMEKVKAMTDTERQAYFEANKSTEKTNVMDELVTRGILTRSEADIILATMPQKQDKGIKDGFGRGDKTIDFTNLVTTGVVDQATADKMTEYMTAKNTERQAEMEKVKAMTDTERQAYFEANKDTIKRDRTAGMVEAGIITQEQSDAIKAAMPVRTDKPIKN